MGLLEGTNSKSIRLVTDLDAILADPVAFRFNGKTHYIRAVTTKEFYQFMDSYQGIVDTLNDPMATRGAIVKSAHSVVSSVCDSITLDDVMQMNHLQVKALFKLIIQSVSGSEIEIDEKKKSATTAG